MDHTTDSTEITTPPKSTEYINSNSSAQISLKPSSQFDFVPQDTEKYVTKQILSNVKPEKPPFCMYIYESRIISCQIKIPITYHSVCKWVMNESNICFKLHPVKQKNHHSACMRVTNELCICTSHELLKYTPQTTYVELCTSHKLCIRTSHQLLIYIHHELYTSQTMNKSRIIYMYESRVTHIYTLRNIYVTNY